MNWRGYEDPDWLGFEWSPWLSLDPEAGDLATIPTEPGLYRVRHRDRAGLAYVGETGRSLRGRIRALARGAYAVEMPFRDPHVGAPCMWALRQEHGPAFQVSHCHPEEATEKATRKSMEAALIASYRRVEGESPTGAFSRMIPGYSMSTYRRDGKRGGPLAKSQTEPYAEPGVGPLDWELAAEPTRGDWMGLDWSDPRPLGDISADVPSRAGVYRLFDEDVPDPLVYIGETTNLLSRLRSHRKDRQHELLFSYALPAEVDAKHKRLEMETDLIGAHWQEVGLPPSDQH